MQDQKKPANTSMTFYIVTRGLAALVVVIIVLWTMAFFIDKIKGPDPVTATIETPASKPAPLGRSAETAQPLEPTTAPPDETPTRSFVERTPIGAAVPAPAQTVSPAIEPQTPKSITAEMPPAVEPLRQPDNPESSAVSSVAPRESATVRPAGVAFVEALIKPLDYELNKRFWGWRPNDIINVTDNVNNFQLGVLEVTRRTTVQLVERLSRTGSADVIDRNLENAMNWLMIKATSYWFPTPESKYKESLRELNRYKAKLVNGTGFFFVRADNLIPLLVVYEDLLGSCGENLVKYTERDGSKVSHFKADDYFYYAKGVASAMGTILEAVHTDFSKTLESRRANELLLQAIEACNRASDLDPWIVTDAELDGILANHRANMASPINDAAFYLSQLMKTLST